MQAATMNLKRELEIAREVILLLAAEVPAERILEPRLQAALELSLTGILPPSSHAAGDSRVSIE